MSITNPKTDYLLKSLFFIDEFSSVTRYSKNRPIKEENNLEHTGWVCTWCYLVGVDIQNKLGIKIDFGTLLSGAVVHDMDETLTGDIPRPTKYYSKELRAEIAEVELDSINQLAKTLEHNTENKNLIDDWKNAKGTASVEQLIVKIADLVSVVYKVWQEMIMLRNNCFLQVAKEIREVTKSYIQNGLGSDFHEVEDYFIFTYLDSCLSLINTCIKSANQHAIAMPSFIRFP